MTGNERIFLAMASGQAITARATMHTLLVEVRRILVGQQVKYDGRIYKITTVDAFGDGCVRFDGWGQLSGQPEVPISIHPSEVLP